MDEALTCTLVGHYSSASPGDVATSMEPYSGACYSEDEFWGDDGSDGDASAVEEFGNAEYSFSDVDLSDVETFDVETLDEDSVEVDYPSDEENSTVPASDGELVDDVDDSMDDFDSEDSHARISSRRPPDREATVVAPLILLSSLIPGKRRPSGGEIGVVAPPSLSLSRIPEELPFLVHNERLSAQLRTQNPWRTLQHYYPPQKRTTDAGPCFPIHDLPIELLCMIAKRLPAESAASFTLSSKRTYMALGTRYLKISDKSSLWKFLLLIEPEFQELFACCICLKLHRPPTSQRTGVPRCIEMWSYVRDTRLPASVTSGLVKMVGRKHFENPRLCQEYLSWAAESTIKTTRHIKVAQHINPRMMDGNLLIRTETYVHPFKDGELRYRSLYELFRLLEDYRHVEERLSDICAHRSWEQSLFVTEKQKSLIHDSLATERNQVVPNWLRRAVLPRRMETMLRQTHLSAETSSPSSVDERVRSCDQCATDYSTTACDVAGVGRCIVFTTWKDLGGVRPGQQDKWDAIFTEDTSCKGRYPKEKAQCVWPPPETYLTFQDLEIPKFKRPSSIFHRYKPVPDRKMLRDLTRRPKGGLYRNDDDEYPTTAIGADTDMGDDVYHIW